MEVRSVRETPIVRPYCTSKQLTNSKEVCGGLSEEMNWWTEDDMVLWSDFGYKVRLNCTSGAQDKAECRSFISEAQTQQRIMAPPMYSMYDTECQV